MDSTEDEEKQLDDILFNMDLDDGQTINTRLAMNSIDSMFCSPTNNNSMTNKLTNKKSSNNKFSARKPLLVSKFEMGLSNELSAIKEVSTFHHYIKIELFFNRNKMSLNGIELN